MRYLISIATFLTIVLFSKGALARDIHTIIREVATKEGAPTDIMSAICWVESKHNHRALNKSDGNGGRDSNGLCQVQLRTAQWLGYKGSVQGLFDPKTNVKYASKYFVYLLKRENNNIYNAIVSYNAGSVILNKRGHPINQQYLNKVLRAMEEGR